MKRTPTEAPTESEPFLAPHPLELTPEYATTSPSISGIRFGSMPIPASQLGTPIGH